MAGRGVGIGLIVVALLALGFVAGGGLLSPALAQGEGAASGVICVVGMDRAGKSPIVLVSVPDQTLMVYEYSTTGTMQFVAARSFRYDKLVPEFGNKGVTVEEVRAQVTGQRQQ